MLKAWFAIVWVIVIGAPSVEASPFVLKDANTIVAVCEAKDPQYREAYCFTYLVAVSEVYFLSNPTCSRPDNGQFLVKVLENVMVSTRAMTEQELASQSAVNVVYQAIAKAHPCQTVEKSIAPNAEACRAGLATLSNAWVNDFQKQAILELLRNNGCLN